MEEEEFSVNASENEPYEVQVFAKEIFGDMPVWVQVKDGLAIHQGDICLGPIEELEIYNGEEIRQEALAGTTNTNRLWPEDSNGIVQIPYIMKNCTPAERTMINNATEEWETATDGYFDFVGHVQTYPGPNSDPRINVRCNASGCMSFHIGMDTVPPQKIAIAGCDGVGNVVHEFGHNLGLLHEHTRRDRDTYLTMYPAFYEPDGDFVKYENSYPQGVDIGPYDYESVMHYFTCAAHIYQNTCDNYYFWVPGAYTSPSMIDSTLTEPYPPGVGQDPDRLLTTDNGDMYGVFRLYTRAWYISSGAREDWIPTNWRHNQGANTTAEDLLVGKFCDDDFGRPNNDDILWLDSSTNDWWAICDAAYPSWRYDGGVGGNTETPIRLLQGFPILPFSEFVLGDFDGFADTVPTNETFTDILINNTNQSDQWFLLQNGPNANQTFTYWKNFTEPVENLAVGVFCNPGPEGYTSDVVIETDTGGPWDVSCSANTDWQSIPSTGGLGDPRNYVMEDFNNDGFTDLMRNADTTWELEIAYAIPPSAGAPANEPVSFGSFQKLNYIKNPKISSNRADNTIDTEDMKYGRFITNGVTAEDGADLFYIVDSRFIVADSKDIVNGDLYWNEWGFFDDYPDEPWNGNYGWPQANPHPEVLIGNFDQFRQDDVFTTLSQFSP